MAKLSASKKEKKAEKRAQRRKNAEPVQQVQAARGSTVLSKLYCDTSETWESMKKSLYSVSDKDVENLKLRAEKIKNDFNSQRQEILKIIGDMQKNLYLRNSLTPNMSYVRRMLHPREIRKLDIERAIWNIEKIKRHFSSNTHEIEPVRELMMPDYEKARTYLKEYAHSVIGTVRKMNNEIEKINKDTKNLSAAGTLHEHVPVTAQLDNLTNHLYRIQQQANRNSGARSLLENARILCRFLHQAETPVNFLEKSIEIELPRYSQRDAQERKRGRPNYSILKDLHEAIEKYLHELRTSSRELDSLDLKVESFDNISIATKGINSARNSVNYFLKRVYDYLPSSTDEFTRTWQNYARDMDDRERSAVLSLKNHLNELMDAFNRSAEPGDMSISDILSDISISHKTGASTYAGTGFGLLFDEKHIETKAVKMLKDRLKEASDALSNGQRNNYIYYLLDIVQTLDSNLTEHQNFKNWMQQALLLEVELLDDFQAQFQEKADMAKVSIRDVVYLDTVNWLEELDFRDNAIFEKLRSLSHAYSRSIAGVGKQADSALKNELSVLVQNESYFRELNESGLLQQTEGPEIVPTSEGLKQIEQYRAAIMTYKNNVEHILNISGRYSDIKLGEYADSKKALADACIVKLDSMAKKYVDIRLSHIGDCTDVESDFCESLDAIHEFSSLLRDKTTHAYLVSHPDYSQVHEQVRALEERRADIETINGFTKTIGEIRYAIVNFPIIEELSDIYTGCDNVRKLHYDIIELLNAGETR